MLHQLLLFWGSKDELNETVTFLEYTKIRDDHVNYGGLLLVTDEFYMFVQGIENKVRKSLTINFLVP